VDCDARTSAGCCPVCAGRDHIEGPVKPDDGWQRAGRLHYEMPDAALLAAAGTARVATPAVSAAGPARRRSAGRRRSHRRGLGDATAALQSELPVGVDRTERRGERHRTVLPREMPTFAGWFAPVLGIARSRTTFSEDLGVVTMAGWFTPGLGNVRGGRHSPRAWVW
jgi:hypothetical protein